MNQLYRERQQKNTNKPKTHAKKTKIEVWIPVAVPGHPNNP